VAAVEIVTRRREHSMGFTSASAALELLMDELLPIYTILIVYLRHLRIFGQLSFATVLFSWKLNIAYATQVRSRNPNEMGSKVKRRKGTA